MNQPFCWICVGEFADPWPTSGDLTTVDCATCGNYEITGSLLASQFPLPESERYRMSFWCKRRQLEGRGPPMLSNHTIGAIVAQLPNPPAHQKPDLLLVSLTLRNPVPGRDINIDEWRERSLACARDQEELRFFLECLRAREHIVMGARSVSITGDGWERAAQLADRPETSRTAFVAMKFNDEMLALWPTAFVPAIQRAGFEPRLANNPQHNEQIDARIVTEVRQCRFVIADVTFAPTGVYFEAGYALGIGRPVIWTCRSDRKGRSAAIDPRPMSEPHVLLAAVSNALYQFDCLLDEPASLLQQLGRAESADRRSGGTSVMRYGATLFDALGRAKYQQSQALSGALSVIYTSYDSLGRIALRSEPYFQGFSAYYTAFGYDLVGRPLTVKRPINEADATGAYPYCTICRTTQYSYQRLTRVITDANGHASTQVSDALSEPVQVTDANGGNTYYAYAPFGDVGTTQDPKGNIVANTYNVRGFKMTSNDPDMGAWQYNYYPTGEVQSLTDAKSQQTSFTYDGVSRARTRTEPEGTTTWTYGASVASRNVGKLIGVSSPGGYTESYSFDSLGRPQDGTTTFDSTSFTVSNGYDATTGLLATVTYPTSTSAVPNSRFEVQYDYAYGLLSDVRDFNTPATVYWQQVASDAAGHPIDEQYGNALHTYSTYDLANELLRTRTTGPSSQVQNLSYQWDNVGNLTERKDLGLNLTEDFSYDSLNRMWQSKLNSTINLGVSYDTNGNILSKSDVGSYDYTTAQPGCSYTGLTAQPHAVRNAGGSAYCYDANGNMVQGAGRSMTWTSYNLPSLISQGGNTAQFFYGAGRARYKQVSVTASGGNLPAGTETTRYVGGLFEQVAKPSGVIEYKHYIMAGSEAVAIRTLRSNGVNDTRYLHHDHLGGVDTITDESANVVVKLSFGAFGARRSPSTWSGTPSASDWSSIAAVTHRGFTNQEALDNVSLIDMNGRVSDPVLGRFVSADPFIQAPLQSQSLNRYSYVMNDPLSLTDPSGYFSFGDLLNPFSHQNPLNPFGDFGKKVFLWSQAPAFAPLALAGASAWWSVKTGDHVLVEYPWLQPIARAAACYWGGPWGCAAASAHLARIDGGSLTDIAVSAVAGYLGGTQGVGTSSGFATEVARDYVNYGVYSEVDRIAAKNGISVTFVDRALLALDVLGRVSGAGTNPDGTTSSAEQILDLPGKVWALPDTLFGLAVGLAGVPFGARPVVGDNGIDFLNYPWGPGGAITFGNVMLFNNVEPGDLTSRYDLGPGSVPIGPHETAHTYQYEVLGPFFGPAYFTLNPFSKGSPFENAADDYAQGRKGWWP